MGINPGVTENQPADAQLELFDNRAGHFFLNIFCLFERCLGYLHDNQEYRALVLERPDHIWIQMWVRLPISVVGQKSRTSVQLTEYRGVR